MNTSNSELFAKFNKDFTHFASLSIEPDKVVFQTASAPHKSCDCARRRINDLNLPLHARVDSYNTFSIMPKI